ncbi:Heterokaryon incompatibility protein [Neofusicoccum parvum]|uniref:Heterokaryon incompatibility protein n=1 Tax=Neofusicoccum parvum TaxID=310453 RepID=A0ACB5SNA4_9PEZI|nr:Heterokaryon incompatibility protein [Neofusicoccum parvum]
MLAAAAAAAQLSGIFLAASAIANTSATPPAPTALAATPPPTTPSTKPATAGTSKPTASPTPSPPAGIPKSAVVIALSVSVPILLALIGSVMIWGYMLGRRDEHDEAREALLRKTGPRPRPGRRRSARRVELAGCEVLEMATGANTAEMPGDSHPAVEMPERGEPVELPALGAWLMMK